MNIFLITITIALIIWITGTLLVIRDIEGPKYVVIEQKDGYEMREYESYIVAEVEVEGDMRTAMNSGFRQLAGYIFGGNTTKSSIAMTVPVMDTTKASENIAMTSPVMERVSNSGKRIVAFTMPSKYTLENLPKPDNENIRFRIVEKSQKAVLRYTWYATSKRVDKKKKFLNDLLIHDGYTIKGEMTSAQYNPPLSFPILRRNEIIVDIE